ncbi:MAG: 16S rRNA processing protein RimM [Bacteroidaceae bacterium]|nr:16S rRNA processing protein RimM [Bacteroidaceae bacterium]MBQ9293821.1 16S rRNA processing protein RimM [Bacteroidaceae bacterium]
MINEQDVYKIGQIGRTHGVKGEVTFQFTDDVWDRAEAPYLFLRVEGLLVPFFLEEYRFRSDTTALLKFLDYDTANDVQMLVGCEVFFPHSLTPEASDDDEYTWRYFTGFELFDEKAGLIGTIDFVDETTQNVLFQVGERYIPAAEDWITDINHKERTISMTLPEGLLDL